MVSNEITDTDQQVRHLLWALTVDSPIWEQGAGSPELVKALQKGSKSKTPKNPGKPEFVFVSNGHLVVIEDKLDHENSVSYNDAGEVDTSYPARERFAANGAVHYAEHIMKTASKHFKSIFAIGVTGNSKSLETHVFHVSPKKTMSLPATEDFREFNNDQIEEFYRVSVLGHLPKAERDLKEVKAIAASIHEDMRNYGNLEGERKAATVSVILLALKNPDFSINQLRASTVDRQTDGWKIYNFASAYLDEAYEEDATGNQKRGAVKDQFAFIRDSITLNQKRRDLGGKSPLRIFAEKLEADVLNHVSSSSSFDILGSFYGEFVKYGGSDGNALGIVLTPHHITTLMADLVEVNKDDYVLDPCAGTAAFLIAAMNRMISVSGGDSVAVDDIRSNRLHGVELQDKLYSVGVTNMILRGDGKSHFRRDDIFHVADGTLRQSEIDGVNIEHGFTKVLMNPPYSQAKTADTNHLAELSFVSRALQLMNHGGQLAAIIPVSSLTNKSKSEKEYKKAILRNHTLEAVITCNTETFYGVGVNPAIAIFTAGKPHAETKRTSFIDYRDDGMYVRPHVGLVGDGTELAKREHLLRVYNGDEDAGTHFQVKTTVTPEDEWVHSYFYFKDDHPSSSNFVSMMSSYITFNVGLLFSGRDDLFGLSARKQASAQSLNDVQWLDFSLSELGLLTKRGRRLKTANHVPGRTPYISSTRDNNGVDAFVGNTGTTVRTFANCLTVANSGSVGSTFFHPYQFVASDHVTAIRGADLTYRQYLFLGTCVEFAFEGKYSFNREISDKRIERERIMLPVTSTEEPDWDYMERYMAWVEDELLTTADHHIFNRSV